MGNTLKGDFLYKEALSLVDYCGDVAKTKAGGEAIYNPDFSPNNIKRLIISPDAVAVFYHIQTRHCAKFKVKMINPMMLQTIQYMADYTPLTAVLYADRICASVEEVIILSNSNDDRVSLTTRELDFSSMLKTYKSGSTDIVDSIRNRYKRLYSYTVLNSSFQEFWNWYQGVSKDDKSGYLLSQQNFFDGAQKQIFHETDWYTGYGTSASFYDLDKEGSRLNQYFKNTIVEIDKVNKKAKVDESIKGAVDKSKTKFERELALYLGTYRCVCRLRKMLAEQMYKFVNVQMVNEYASFDIEKATLVKTSLTKESTKDYNVVTETGSEVSLIEQNIKTLKRKRMEFYEIIYADFMNKVTSLSIDYPTMVDVMLKDFPKTGVHGIDAIRKPIVFDELGISLTEGSFIQSVVIICWFSCRLFVSPDGKNISEYVKDSKKWEEVAEA